MRENYEIKNLLKSKDVNIELDYTQCEIIKDENSKVLVIAGAGSGKTTTLLAKVIYLIKYLGVKENEILVIAFTNAAVNEIKMRLQKYNFSCGKVLTFHKLAIEIINSCGKNLNYIVDGKEEFGKSVEKLLNSDKLFKKYVHKIFQNCSNSQVIDNLYTIFHYIKSNGILFSTINNLMMRYLIEKCNNAYRQVMSDNNYCDYDDLIITSTLILNRERKQLNYKYILIDEYQDISRIRYYLIKVLLQNTHAKLLMVGDDWQSIYGFSGSDINLFYDEIKESKVYYLTNTYRNSQELLNFSSSFIQKNSNHLKKKLLSKKNLVNPIKYYYYFSFTKKRCLIKMLNNIPNIDNRMQTIFLLGRFKRDEQFISGINNIKKIDNHRYMYKKAVLEFYTIHAVKGLSADHVVILNMVSGEYGFPSNKKNYFLSKTITNTNKIHDLEERRLFYVALTRTRNYVYLMIPYINHSSYVEEIKRISS